MRALFATMLGLWCVWNTAYAQSAGILSGRVLDAHGNPVADAHVYYYPNFMMAWLGVSLDRLPHATTDAQGRYRITGADPACILSAVVAFHPELGCNVLRLGTKPPRDVRLEPLKQVTGKVVDANGKPVVGAQVRLAYVRVGDGNALVAPPVPPFITSTDAEGNFQLPIHPKTEGVVIACTAPGYEPLEYMSGVNWDRLLKEGLKLTLRPGARITAQLVYAHNGEPVKDYPVVTVPGFSAITDESGRITLDVAASSVMLRPGFSLSSPTLVPPGFFKRVQVKDLKPGTTTDLGVIHVFVEPQVTIEVRDEKGNPVPFCGVNIDIATEQNASSVIPYFTDGKGRLTIALPDGEYVVIALGQELGNTFYEPSVEYTLSVQQGKVQTPQPVVLNVITATRALRMQPVKMRVRTSRDQAPKKVWMPFGGAPFEDMEGRGRPYRMDGDTLSIEASRDRIDRLVIVDTGTQEGTVLRNLNVQNPPKLVRLQPLPRIYGRVLDTAGKPVVGAKVSLMYGQEATYEVSGGGTQQIWEELLTPLFSHTDKAGRFTLPVVPEGRCWAIVTAKGYEPAALILKKGQSPTIRLKRATGEYTGMLVDDYGEPIARASLAQEYRFADAPTASSYQQRRVPMRSISLGNVTTDDAGRFSLKEMPSSLLLTLRVQNMPPREMTVKPSRDLVLTVSTTRPPWESEQQPSPPDVEKLLRRVQWLQPVQWEGKNTLLVFTAPYVAQNQRLMEAIKQQMPDGWQVAIVLDTISRQEVERYGKQAQLETPVGYWKRSPQRPALPVLPQILPALPYVVYIGQDGKPQRQGITIDELPKLFGARP